MTEEPDKPANEDPEKTGSGTSGDPANEAPKKPRKPRKPRKPENESSAGAKRSARKTPPGTESAAAPKPASRRLVWVRGFYMLLMLLVWQVAEAVLIAVTIVQFIFDLVGEPNERLTAFGDSLATYLQQIGRFLSYATDDLPFPFADWPTKV